MNRTNYACRKQISPLAALGRNDKGSGGRFGRNDNVSATNNFDAAFAEIGILGVGSYSGPVVPAALAFFGGAFLCRDDCLANGLLQFYLANDAQGGELFEPERVKCFGIFVVAIDRDTGLLITRYLFLLPEAFEDSQDLIAKGHELFPSRLIALIIYRIIDLWHKRQMHAFRVFSFEF